VYENYFEVHCNLYAYTLQWIPCCWSVWLMAVVLMSPLTVRATDLLWQQCVHLMGDWSTSVSGWIS